MSIKVSVHGVREDTMRIKVRAGGFNIIIDEPEAFGGTNQGPNPVEILLAALAGCINVVGTLVAGDMGLQIEEMKVDVSGSLDLGKLMGATTDGRAGFEEVTAKVHVKFSTDVDAGVVEEFLEKIESRCPVSDVFSGTTRVNLVPA